MKVDEKERRNLPINRLIKVLHEYRNIPEVIYRKQRVLKCKLQDPTISAMKGYAVFRSVENEIIYLEQLYKTITSVINSLSEKHERIVRSMIDNSNSYLIASEAGFRHTNIRQFYREVNKIWEIFEEALKVENIYKDEKGYEKN